MKRIIYSLVAKFDLKYDLTRRHKISTAADHKTQALELLTLRGKTIIKKIKIVSISIAVLLMQCRVDFTYPTCRTLNNDSVLFMNKLDERIQLGSRKANLDESASIYLIALNF